MNIKYIEREKEREIIYIYIYISYIYLYINITYFNTIIYLGTKNNKKTYKYKLNNAKV